MNTLQLARKLGLVETIHVSKEKNKQTRYSIQQYSHLLVLDFESTCWENTHHIKPEIIEFSVVLYSIKTSKIEAEFQQYVMPLENPKLSEFCIKFTGITQSTVDNGVPLGTCLMLFDTWIKEQQNKFKIVLLQDKNCVFVTWSDWDLGNCLLNECRRKRIRKPEYFKSWVDLRGLYKEYYNRKPNGLKGALNEVGLNFKGVEHCGLHDARNTAFLAGRLIQDGALIQITKQLDV